MSLLIDWPTGIITVPKADMLLVQSSPIEIRELNLNTFRLELKALENSPAGMTFPKTHNHNTIVEISGIQLARVIEMLPPYTVTFEDGNYATNLVGANSNIADRVNLNQVSVRSANSAGLIQTRELEYASFKGATYIDVINGAPGTTYPLGTESNPADNLFDAKFIADLRGFSTLNIIGDITIDASDNIANYVIQGQGATFNNPKTIITLIDGCVTSDTEFRDCRIDGVQGGESIYTDCVIGSITNTHCKFNNCGMVGPVQVYKATGYDWVKTHTTDLKDCYTSITWYELDFNDSSLHQVYTNFSGKLKITNYTNNESELVLQIDAGEVWLTSTCSGTAPITIVGVGTLLNESTLVNVDTDGLLNKNTVATAVESEIGEEIQYSAFSSGITVDTSAGVSGTLYPIGTPLSPVNNIPDAMTIAGSKGFGKLYIIGDIILDTGDNIQNMLVVGQDQILTSITVESGANVINSKFQNSYITGTLDGGNILQQCRIENINYVNGYIWECLLEPGTITLAGGATAHMMDCWSGQPGLGTPTIDMGGSGQALGLRGYNGGIALTNKTGPESVSIDLSSGQVVVNDTIISGTVVIRGSGQLHDYTTSTGVIVNSEGLMSKGTISEAVLNTSLIGFDVPNTVAASMKLAAYDNKVTISTGATSSGILYPIGTIGEPVNNLNDAITIATTLGFTTLQFISNYIFDPNVNISNFDIYGNGQQETTFTVLSGSILAYCSVNNCTVTGDFFGINQFNNCIIEDLTATPLMPTSGTLFAKECSFRGIISSAPNLSGEFDLYDCYGLPDNDGSPPIIDLQGCNANVQLRNYSGILKLANITQTTDIRLFLASGGLELLPSVTAGNFTITGPGTFIDNSTSWDSLDIDGLMNKTNVATAVWNQTQSIKHLVESLRETHSSFGNIYYWDPYLGNDSLDGTTPEKATATFAQAQSYCTDARGDIIFGLSTNPSGLTIVDEQIIINKVDISIRGAGKDFLIKPTTTSGHSVIIESEGASIIGLGITTTSGNTSGYGIQSMADNALIVDCTIFECHTGVHISGGADTIFKRCNMHHNTSHGLLLNGLLEHIWIMDSHIGSNGGNGIHVDPDIGSHEVNFIGDGEVHTNYGYGIWIGPNAEGVHLEDGVRLFDNVSGNVFDSGTNTYIETDAKTDAQTSRLQYLIESPRGTHAAYGNVFYWDPYSGNDALTGRTPENAVRSFTVAQSKCVNYNNDIIFAFASDPSGVTTVTGSIVIDVDSLQLRGPGNNLNLTSISGSSVEIIANSVGLTGFRLSQEGSYDHGNHCLTVSGVDDYYLSNLFISNGRDDGIHLEDCKDGILENLDIRSCKHIGIHVKNVTYSEMKGTNIIHYCGLGTGLPSPGHGIWLDESTHGFHIHTGTEVHNCGGYGIYTGPDSQETAVHPDTRLFSNQLGNYLSDGNEDSIGITLGTEPLESLTYRVESLRKRAPAHGRIVYYDPILGDDDNDGHRPDRAKGTFAGAHDEVTDGGRDVIQILDSLTGSEALELDEQWIISKNDLSVRGPGWDLLLYPTATTGATITITGEEISLEKIQVRTSSSGTNQTCIEVFSDNCNLNNMKVKRSTFAGIMVHSDNIRIEDCLLEHHTSGGGYGIRLLADSHENNIVNNFVYDCNYNMYISGTSHENVLKGNVLHDALIAGLYIAESTEHTYIHSDNIIANNATDIIDNSSGTYYQASDQAEKAADKVWSHDVSDHNTVGTTGHALKHIEYLRGSIYVDTSATINGDGTQEHPSNNINDAIVIANELSIKSIYLYSDVTLTSSLNNFIITGVGTPTVDTNGQDLDNTEFTHCQLTGIYAGTITVQQSVLLSGFHLNGFFENCGLVGDLACIAGANVLIKDCASLIPGLNRPTISMNTGAVSQLSLRGYSGGITIKDCDNPLDRVTAEISVGSLTFDSSCVSGEMVARGLCKFVDETTGAIVTDETVWNTTIANAIWKEPTFEYTTSGTYGKAVSDINLDTNIISNDITNIGNDVTEIYNKLPAGTIASAGEYNADFTVLKSNVERALGLAQENYYIDNTQYADYNGAKLMTYGRMRIYNDQESVGTDNNVIGVYIVNTSWNGDEMSTYKVRRIG